MNGMSAMLNSETTYQFEVDPKGTLKAAGSDISVKSKSTQNSDPQPQYPDSLGSDTLLIALIGPDDQRRKAVSSALAACRGGQVREISAYPAGLDDVPRLLEQRYDVILMDLDSSPEYALELVESIGANGTAT